jgi:cell division protein FtsX
MDFGGLILVVLGAAAAIAYLTFVVVAFVQIVRDRSLTWQAQAIWLVTILMLPLGGTIAWFAVGHRTKEFERMLAR